MGVCIHSRVTISRLPRHHNAFIQKSHTLLDKLGNHSQAVRDLFLRSYAEKCNFFNVWLDLAPFLWINFHRAPLGEIIGHTYFLKTSFQLEKRESHALSSVII